MNIHFTTTFMGHPALTLAGLAVVDRIQAEMTVGENDRYTELPDGTKITVRKTSFDFGHISKEH